MNILYSLRSRGRLIGLLCLFLFLELFRINSQVGNMQQLDESVTEIYKD